MQIDEMADLLALRTDTQNAQRPAAAALREVRIFQKAGVSTDFLDFLAQHIEERVFLLGQKVIDEFAPDDRCMYMLSQGVAKVIKGTREVALLNAGAVFGEIIVLGLASKRTASVIAAETCYMQVLHQSVVVRGLELFPQDRNKVLKLAFASDGVISEAPSQRESQEAPMLDLASAEASQHRRTSAQNPSFMKALRQSSLFASIDPGFMEDLSKVCHDRIYMPGDLIIEEGKRGDSMFIMLSGNATVFVTDPDQVGQEKQANKDGPHSPGSAEPGSPASPRRGTVAEVKLRSFSGPEMTSGNKRVMNRKVMSRIGVLTPGSISGELAMLGVSLIRSATIEAVTICSMWEITQEEALAILERYHDAQHHFAQIIVDHLERTVPSRMLHMPLFKAFDRKFRMLLGLYCERRAYFPGQRIQREAQPGERLYIVNQGRATLKKKGVTVKTYVGGSYFGSTVMLGLHKVYLGTLTALQTCHILIITRTSYQQALEQYPSLVAAQELKKTEKTAGEELREAIQRISSRKLIWKRYQCQLLDSRNPDAQKLTETELLERAFQVWSDRVNQLLKSRRQRDRERGQYKEMMEKWVQKKQQARLLLAAKNGDMPSKMHTARPSTVNDAAHHKELVKVLEDWPMPRPSPHYKLRVFGVLHESATRPATGAPLLPILKQRQVRSGGGKLLGEASHHLGEGAKSKEDPWWRQDNNPFDGGDGCLGEGLDEDLGEISPGDLLSGEDLDDDFFDMQGHAYSLEGHDGFEADPPNPDRICPLSDRPTHKQFVQLPNLVAVHLGLVEQKRDSVLEHR